jgi:hypothetical protein
MSKFVCLFGDQFLPSQSGRAGFRSGTTCHCGSRETGKEAGDNEW